MRHDQIYSEGIVEQRQRIHIQVMNWLPDLVFLDLETTGATPLVDRIIEIGLIKIENGEALQWKTFVNPGITISPFITQLTCITDADVEHAPTFKQVRKGGSKLSY